MNTQHQRVASHAGDRREVLYGVVAGVLRQRLRGRPKLIMHLMSSDCMVSIAPAHRDPARQIFNWKSLATLTSKQKWVTFAAFAMVLTVYAANYLIEMARSGLHPSATAIPKSFALKHEEPWRFWHRPKRRYSRTTVYLRQNARRRNLLNRVISDNNAANFPNYIPCFCEEG